MADRKGYPRGWKAALSRTLNLGRDAKLSVTLTSTSTTAVPLQRPDEPGEVPGLWTHSSFQFVVRPDGPMGRFRFEIPNAIQVGRITQLSVESSDDDGSSIAITRIFTPEFTQKLTEAAQLLSEMRGRWTPPGGTIFIKDGRAQRAPQQGHFVPLRADYRKPRVGERHWEDTDEIDRIVALQKKAEGLVNKKSQLGKDNERPRSANQTDIEKWIAEQSGVWSQGTVHRQLQIARHKGKIKPKKRGRKKAT